MRQPRRRRLPCSHSAPRGGHGRHGGRIWKHGVRARPGSGGARGHLARGGRARGTRAAAGHGARGGAAGLSLSSPAPLPLTSQGAGTYSFDTARRAWRKEDDWALPFRGKAVRDDDHAGGCGLWFGISSAPGRRLCAAHLGERRGGPSRAAPTGHGGGADERRGGPTNGARGAMVGAEASAGGRAEASAGGVPAGGGAGVLAAFRAGVP